MLQLDKEQKKYELTMQESPDISRKYKKAQRWLDDSDFIYSK
jgi:hypothetical protein